MTKSTITREQLEEWVAQFDEDGGCDATDRQLEALIRQSLAALDSEPVAEVVSIYGDPEAFGEREIRPLIGIQQMPYGTKLYRHAQPAPVVPEEKPIPNTLSMYAVDAVAAIAEVKGWNACRAAMLAAAPQSPGSEPATVPGKWIPVSEQMPPSRHEVLVGRWWGEKPRWCCKWATYIPGHPDSQSSGWLIPGASWTPTHWMPLPAAPQEPKP
ncbi:TPA: DUF551 domain-containing protein [Klebsiella pneumoniae]|nr:DUF551 domain-containing protein [Klebsiella pneumoniae]MCS6672813.1 DUF551 domain-containing protein [Klebsiella pneumoniae subsp. pneumoniae]HCF8308833.1 DUF551 domain-containing protein [Klebsiella pneumoniae]HCF8683751.1 DUF551 domain-containing protein [Klebsiella pneumoniae]HED8854878.1 DUF551 domain-containing protein [Klebsiella pneumoniae]